MGVTTLYVTHDQIEAMSLGDRIVVMNAGEIQQVDTPQNLYYKPANSFVAKYIGQRPMNFFAGHCEQEGFVGRLKTEQFQMAIPAWKTVAIEKQGYWGKDVLVGIRMENIYFDQAEARNHTDGELCKIAVTIKNTEFLGDSTILYLDVNGDTIVAESKKYTDYQVGTQIEIYIDTEMLHFFDLESGEAIAH